MSLNSILNLSKARHLSQTSWSVYSCNTKQVFSTTSRNQKRINNVCFKDPENRLQSIKTGKKVNHNMPLTTGARNFSAIKQPQYSSDFFFRQLFDRISCTYTYMLADSDTGEAVLIDPVIELAERDVQTAKDLGLTLKYCINTHMHADHITGTGLLKKLVPEIKSVISKYSGAEADVLVEHGSVIEFGKHKLEVLATPGHTNGCVTYLCKAQSCAFTGDTVLIRGCGRTDFQEGNPSTLYDSVWNKIFSLPEVYRLFPAHDYKGQTSTSVAEEKNLNPRLTKTKEEFIKIMENLNLSYPAQIDIALPANKVCGLYNLPDKLKHLMEDN